MTRLTLPRRQFLTLGGAAFAASALGGPASAQGAAAPISFGYQATSWGTIGMLCEAEGLFKKAGANVNIFKFDGTRPHATP